MKITLFNGEIFFAYIKKFLHPPPPFYWSTGLIVQLFIVRFFAHMKISLWDFPSRSKISFTRIPLTF